MPQLPLLDPAAQQTLHAELQPGERLIWADQPLPGLLRRRSIPVMIFGVIFTAFSVVWIAGAGGMLWFAHSAAGFPSAPFSFFPCCGLPFFAVGLGMLASPFLAGRTARRTVYAITDRRALSITSSFFRGYLTTQSFAPDRLTHIERRERPDGSGDLVFEEFHERRGSSSYTTTRGFLAIANVREVEAVLVNALLKDRTRQV